MKTLGIALSVTLAAALPAWADLGSAAYRGDLAETRRLIAEKADLDKRNRDGWTPLMTAVYWEQFEVANLLLAAGADPNVQATRTYNWKVVRGATPLTLCGIFGYQEMAASLLRAGADPFHRDLDGQTVRSLATKRGFGGILDLLPVEAGSSEPPVTLLEAARNRQTLAVQACIARKADLEQRDGNGWSPLMLAVYARDETIAALLLEAGADPNVQSSADAGSEMLKGTTALIMCGYYGLPAMAARLLKAKADPGLCNRFGYTAGAFAAKFHFREVLEVLDPTGGLAEGPRSSSLLEAARKRDLAAIKLLLAEKADPDARDWKGWTPLMHAVHQEDEKAVILLLGAGADPNLQSLREGSLNQRKGTTALILCGYHGQAGLAARLLKAGADASLADASGNTAAFYAARFGFQDVLALLPAATPSN